MTSLLTAASLAPLAAQGSDLFNAYVILLALLSGLFQLAFGILRMGVLLNFLSHPVLWGFINAGRNRHRTFAVADDARLSSSWHGPFPARYSAPVRQSGRDARHQPLFRVASIAALILFKQKCQNYRAF